jgi:hypothetical protein
MRCPQCGSDDLLEVTPGFYQCTGERMYMAPVDPASQGAMRPVYEPCRYEFQTNPARSDTPRCRCGQFAVGICSLCESAYCGEHRGELQADQRTCQDCTRERAQRLRAAAVQAEAIRKSSLPQLSVELVLDALRTGVAPPEILRAPVPIRAMAKLLPKSKILAYRKAIEGDMYYAYGPSEDVPPMKSLNRRQRKYWRQRPVLSGWPIDRQSASVGYDGAGSQGDDILSVDGQLWRKEESWGDRGRGRTAALRLAEPQPEEFTPLQVQRILTVFLPTVFGQVQWTDGDLPGATV